MQSDREALAQYVRQLRKARGLTLRAAAAVTGLSHGYIDSIEHNRPAVNVTLQTLYTLIQGLGGRMTLVFGGDDELTREEWSRVALLTRALIAARNDASLSVVVGAALDMIESRLALLERQGEPAQGQE